MDFVKIYLLRKLRFLTLMTLLGFAAYLMGYGSARLLKNYAIDNPAPASEATIISKKIQQDNQVGTVKNEQNQSIKKKSSEPQNRLKSNLNSESNTSERRNPAQLQKSK